MSWDVSGSGLGTFSDRFGMVLEEMSDGIDKRKISKTDGTIFPALGGPRSRQFATANSFTAGLTWQCHRHLKKKCDLAVLAVGSGTAKARRRPCFGMFGMLTSQHPGLMHIPAHLDYRTRIS